MWKIYKIERFINLICLLSGEIFSYTALTCLNFSRAAISLFLGFIICNK